MKKELDKNYNPNIESKIYENWVSKKYFHAEADKDKKPFTIVMPPPNITGQLHMGHALNNTLQDVLIRTKRMQGYSALWIPGTDHAAIATEIKIVEDMAEEGLTKDDLGREKFLERAWLWKEKYGNTITSQLRKIGCSCDWDRERFTLDDGLSEAVLKVFISLYEKDLIYKGERLINWCPHCQTSISEAEVNHVDKEAKLYYLKYQIKDSDEFLMFATTRPETILGDTAIAVSPDDDRYKHLVGKTVTVPIVEREIPIIADFYVDKEYGSGVVKITPAHDPNDFEVGKRANLPIINILNDDGTINENGGKYNGQTRESARENILEEFKNLGLFVKDEDLTHAVGVHERCDAVVEPALKSQWFVKMEAMAKKALDVLYKEELRFVPNHFSKIYIHWLENIQDWCISRQIWWGHRIPAHYCEKCGHMEVTLNAPLSCSKCGHDKFSQDEDTLDTWFSSALWPFSTLGWPEDSEDSEDYKFFFPTDVLVTSYDIIFFWVVRMVFSSLEQTEKLPFKDVLINGLLRDELGRKMSKSLGNGIDPLEIIENYGADALRLTLLTGNSPGNDMRFKEDKLNSDRNFLNKLWNATRFVMMNYEEETIETPNRVIPENLTREDKWIISKANNLINVVTSNIESYELGIALQNVYDFIWDEYCDWYIEMVKPRLYDKDDATRNAALYTLVHVLKIALKLLHPFLPFITEEIYTTVQSEEETIMTSPWPCCNEEFNFSDEEKNIEIIKSAVKSIRNIRVEMNVAPSKKVNVFVVSEDEKIREIFKEGESFFKILARGEEIIIQNNNDGIEDDAISTVIENGIIYLPFKDLVDLKKEEERLQKEKEKISKELERAKNKLTNEGFTSKAPEKLIEEEKEKVNKYASMLEQLDAQLEKIKK